MVEYTRDARSLVRLYENNGTLAGEVKLPGLGTATGFQGSGTNPELSSRTRTIYRPRA